MNIFVSAPRSLAGYFFAQSIRISINRSIRAFLAAMILMFAGNANAASYVLDAGNQLIGANGVDVGGTLYNVVFEDGNCVTVLNGCDELTDFDFFDTSTALQVSDALLTQVFSNNDLYDEMPELTRGCVATDRCAIATVYGFDTILPSLFSGVIVNFEDALGDFTTTLGLSPTFDYNYVSYARWEVAAVVPIPAAVWLFGTALIGLIGFGKRRKIA